MHCWKGAFEDQTPPRRYRVSATPIGRGKRGEGTVMMEKQDSGLACAEEEELCYEMKWRTTVCVDLQIKEVSERWTVHLALYTNR